MGARGETSPTRAAVAVWRLLLAALFLLTANGAVEAAGLFHAARSQDVRSTTLRESSIHPEYIKRSRLVRIDQDELARHVVPPSSDHAPDRAQRAMTLDGIVLLQLFPDAVLTVRRTNAEAIEAGGISWTGLAEARPFGSAVFIVNRGEILGYIQAGSSMFRIDPVGNGVHRITEIDQSMLPRGDDAIRVGSPARSLAAPHQKPDQEASTTVTVIDVLVAYTRRTQPDIQRGEVALQLAAANEAFRRSAIPIRLRSVGTYLVDGYGESGLPLRQVFNFLTASTDVAAARDLAGADLVSFWVRTGGLGRFCGLAHMPVNPHPSLTQMAAFSAVDLSCTIKHTFPHEIAHNLGGDHDRYALKKEGLNFPNSHYNFGYVNLGRKLRDILSYRDLCQDRLGRDCVPLGIFSSSSPCTPTNHPQCSPPAIMGIKQGGAGAADASRRLTETRFAVAQYRTKWTISPDSAAVSEGSGKVKFSVTRADASRGQVVYVTTINEDGAASVVVPKNKEPLAFAPGQKSKQVVVNLNDNCDQDGQKKFAVIIQHFDDDEDEVFLAKATLTIFDDDGDWGLTPGYPGVLEQWGEMTIHLTRPTSQGSQTVFVSTADDEGFSNDDDYTPLSNVPVKFAEGETTKTIKILINNDQLPEADETFGVRMLRGSCPAVTTTFKILNDDSWLVGGPAAIGSEGNGTLHVPVVRGGFDQAPATVYLTTTSDRGFPNQNDFASVTNQPVVLAQGMTGTSIPIAILDNAIFEPTETFGVVLRDSKGRLLASGTFQVFDNDEPIERIARDGTEDAWR